MLFTSAVLVGCGGSQPDGSGFQHDKPARFFLDAMKIRSTDPTGAIGLLNRSIDERPSHSAYFHRGWLYALQQKDDEAKSDVKSGLALEPESRDLKWLEKELGKPSKQRKLDMPPAPVK
jgi:hypothetical protein